MLVIVLLTAIIVVVVIIIGQVFMLFDAMISPIIEWRQRYLEEKKLKAAREVNKRFSLKHGTRRTIRSHRTK